MNIIIKLKNLGNKLSYSFKRFPMALLFAASVVSILIFINHLDYNLENTREMYSRIAMTLALGIPLSLSLAVFFEGKTNVKNHTRILGYIGIGVALTSYYLLFLENQDMVAMTRYMGYTIALYLLFSIIPYFTKRKNYELYVIRLCTRFFVTYLYSVILYLGIAAIIATINLLFNAEISPKLYGDMAFIVGGVFAPAFFLADVPRRGEEVSLQSYPKVLSVLLQFIVLPLLSVYTVILYIYFGKIIITMELPKGVIGNLVLWYSIISTIVLFLIYQLRNANQWVKTFIAILPKAILPLIGMMFVAIAIRINEYGITENRYFVLVAGLWVTGVMIYYSIKKDVINIFVATSIAIIAIVAVTGPLSAYSISKMSQNNRFETVIKQYNMIDESGNIKSPEKDFEEVDKKKVSGVIRYFDQYHDLNDIKYLPNDFEISDMKNLFGFDLVDDYGNYENNEYFNHILQVGSNLVNIKDFDYLIEYETYGPTGTSDLNESSGDYEVVYNNNSKELVIKNKEEVIYKNNLEKIFAQIHNKSKGKDNTDKKEMISDQKEMTFVDENDKVKIQVIFRNINGFEDRSTDGITIESMAFYALVKIK
jgi:hypothetical protein